MRSPPRARASSCLCCVPTYLTPCSKRTRRPRGRLRSDWACVSWVCGAVHRVGLEGAWRAVADSKALSALPPSFSPSLLLIVYAYALTCIGVSRALTEFLQMLTLLRSRMGSGQVVPDPAPRRRERRLAQRPRLASPAGDARRRRGARPRNTDRRGEAPPASTPTRRRDPARAPAWNRREARGRHATPTGAHLVRCLCN